MKKDSLILRNKPSHNCRPEIFVLVVVKQNLKQNLFLCYVFWRFSEDHFIFIVKGRKVNYFVNYIYNIGIGLIRIEDSLEII